MTVSTTTAQSLKASHCSQYADGSSKFLCGLWDLPAHCSTPFAGHASRGAGLSRTSIQPEHPIACRSALTRVFGFRPAKNFPCIPRLLIVVESPDGLSKL